MSNHLFNIRFGKRHLQIMKDRPYITFRKNDYWDFKEMPSWFEVYCLFGKHFH